MVYYTGIMYDAGPANEGLIGRSPAGNRMEV